MPGAHGANGMQDKANAVLSLSGQKHHCIVEQGACAHPSPATPPPEGSAWMGILLTEIERNWREFREEQQKSGLEGGVIDEGRLRAKSV